MNRFESKQKELAQVCEDERLYRTREMILRSQGCTEQQFLNDLNVRHPLNGKASLDSLNLFEFPDTAAEKLLKMAFGVEAFVTIRRVEHYFIFISKKGTVDKYDIAKKYNLVQLQAKCALEVQEAEQKKAASMARLKKMGKFPGLEKKIEKN
uniref:Myosin motor domain-containing protein n=1 Tax=Caenorhabditis tropicalis TaxID=1561998 RepID=A0A1I7TGT4_9PELO